MFFIAFTSVKQSPGFTFAASGAPTPWLVALTPDPARREGFILGPTGAWLTLALDRSLGILVKAQVAPTSSAMTA
ncbi:hypothetical protein DSO57_1032813 [Entomophthora muscae]|uniref:Uncharacterized protein n=1 Tax=Entomophthora muscae TaxID=34485 RepID=A0ACC2SPD6_9FUNG|nr:hypothetical protein DSO57_1032813 [Entomophthora muscae]